MKEGGVVYVIKVGGCYFIVFFSDSLPGFDDQSPVMKSALHTHYAHLTNTTALR